MEQPEREALFTQGNKVGITAQAREREKRLGWSPLLVAAGAVTTIGSSLPVGYNIGVVNAPAETIKAFCNESVTIRFGKELNTDQLDLLWSSIVSIFLVGGAIGSLGGSFLADRVGRKGGLIVSSIFGTFAGILFCISKVSNSVEMLIIGRLSVGLSSGLITSIMPMYLMELTPLHIKGSTGVLCPLGVTVGVLLGQIMSLDNVLGNENFWPYCLAVYLIPLVFCGFILIFMPESPKYLFVIRKEPQLALQQLCKIRKLKPDDLEVEIQELRTELQDNESKIGSNDSWSIHRVLMNKSLFLPIVLVCSLQAGQQFSGINAVFYYSVSIFQKAGLTLQQSQLATIGAGICNLFMAIISIPIMANFDRRSVITASLSSTAFFLFVLALTITYIKNYTWMPYISIVGVLGFVLCYGLGLGPIPYFIGSELFEVGPRPSAMALGSMSNWGGNFVIGLCFPIMQNCIGAASFFIFGLIVVCLCALCSFYLPETRGKDVSEVAYLCRDGFFSKPLQPPVSATSIIDNSISHVDV